jgi:hypothetical protein
MPVDAAAGTAIEAIAVTLSTIANKVDVRHMTISCG